MRNTPGALALAIGIIVAGWTVATAAASIPNARTARIQLKNGHSLTGQVVALYDDELVFLDEEGSLDIPLTHVQEMEFQSFSPLKWQRTSSLPLKVNNHQNLAFLKGRVYYPGGRDESNDTLKKVYETRPGPDGYLARWRETRPYPRPTHHSGVCVARGRLYVIAGHHAGWWHDDVYSASMWGDGLIYHWRREKDLPNATGGFGCVTHENFIYAIGGGGGNWNQQEHVFYTEVKHDRRLDGWKATTPLPRGLTKMGAVVVKDRIYVAGGRLGRDSISKEILTAEFKEDGSLGNWRKVGCLPQPMYRFHLFATPDLLLAVGGRNHRGQVLASSIAAPLRPDGTVGDWKRVGRLPGPRSVFAAGRSGSGRIYVAGGEGPDGKKYSDVFYRQLTERDIAFLHTDKPARVSPEAEEALVAYWPFDRNGRDASGNHHSMRVHGGGFGSGVSGRALHLNGNDAYAMARETAPFVFEDASFSIGFYMKTSWEGLGDFARILTLGGPGYNQYEVRFLGRGRICAKIHTEKSAVVCSPGKINDGKWHHVLLVRDNENAELRLYIDRVLVRECKGGAGLFENRTGRSRLTIGRMLKPVAGGHEWSYFRGAIDEVKVYRGVVEPEMVFDFNDAVGWENKTGDQFSVQSGALHWQADRRRQQSFYRRITPFSGDFALEFDFQISKMENNSSLEVGLADVLPEKRDSDKKALTGVFLHLGRTKDDGSTSLYYVRPKVSYACGQGRKKSLDAGQPGRHIRLEPDRWYHATLQPTALHIEERNGRHIGTLKSALPRAPWKFQYLYIGSADRDKRAKGKGALDNLRLRRGDK